MSKKPKMTQLPNGDVLIHHEPGHERPDTVDMGKLLEDMAPDPVEEAVKKAKEDPHRPNIECVWCGQDHFEDEEAFNEHVRARHADVFGESAERARREHKDRTLMQRAADRLRGKREEEKAGA